MTTHDVSWINNSKGEDAFPLDFGEWIKHRRQALNLTQGQLAQRVNCSIFAIRKIESGERRPSRQLAELLARSLEISPEDQTTFVKVARGDLGVERLQPPVCDTKVDRKSGVISGNLPRSLTPFIGREPELNALSQLLADADCRLLTILGPGGIGKTRLAVEAAQHSRELFMDGVWFIPLVSLQSPTLIVPAIASSINFKFQDSTNPQGQLLRYLRTKNTLLLLDNAEHLLEGMDVLTEILNDCPQVKLLVTSRERLNLLSEWVFEIQGLPLPSSDQVEQFEAYSAVALFLQNARRVRTGFELRENERKWVLKICQTMEGMPLGIELSAAWIGLLPIEEIAKEIERNLDFLSVSIRDLPERHRSLRATLDHSWKLLKPEEKLTLSRLSVFHGSFSRDAAQVICGATLPILSSLKDKTLLYRNDQEFYSLHEIIRQYARQKLVELPDELERIRDLHGMYYVHCLAEWEKALQSSQQVETFNQMAQVIDNLSQGWRHMVTSCRPGAGKNSKLCAELLHSALFSISLFYEMHRRSLEAIALFKESVEYLQAIQDEFEETEDNLRFISVLGHIMAHLGLHHIYILKYEKASEILKQAIQLLEQSNSKVERAQAQVMLAAVYNFRGQLQDSTALLEESRDIFREEGNDWWYLLSITNNAHDYLSLGKHQESEALFEEGFRLVLPGDLRLGLVLRSGYGYLLTLKGDYVRAERLLQEALQLSDQFGNDRQTNSILFNLGRVALATERIKLAEEYYQKCIDLQIKYGDDDDLAMMRIYLGKSFAARHERLAALDQFRQAIKIGQQLGKFFIIYWGLVNIARTYLEQGQSRKALDISTPLMHSPVEFIRIQDEAFRLFEDLKAVFPDVEIEPDLAHQYKGEMPDDQAISKSLALALEGEHE
jgi:predicted ATPase/transcriptional regulator with XRE-family HTH domain/Tfp pilus assembly protein PilF